MGFMNRFISIENYQIQGMFQSGIDSKGNAFKKKTPNI